jgi:selenocysteine lyase/cysteine desulfurase
VLKEKMGIANMLEREKELSSALFAGVESIQGVHILAESIRDRLGILSFYADDIHYNLMVKILNDRFGIQSRGGCSCAGTYGHYLLNIDQSKSKEITDMIDKGNLASKPGWVRITVHPIMTDEEIEATYENLPWIEAIIVYIELPEV